MQLKFKRISLLLTVFIYLASFLFQSNFSLLQALAEEKNIPRVNIVAVLVDDKIYNGISSDLKRYTTEYVQKKLTDTKALVMRLDLSNISAYDIHRMMENVYFDGLEGVNSSLIGLIMVGSIPLPVVNQNGYIFPTVYPYVDFEDQKYIRDPDSQYFVYNGNPGGQAEIWHGLIDYGSDISAYRDFFGKLEHYGGIGTGFWYEDFIASKEGFLNENFSYYRNKIMFGEDLSYQRYSPLMKKVFEGESTNNSVDVLSDLGREVGGLGGDASAILDSIDNDSVRQLQSGGGNNFHSTKVVQQEIQDAFLADYEDMFSKANLSTMRENVLAGGRWSKNYMDDSGKKSIVADIDSSASMIQLKDTMYLGTDNLQGLLENLNELMEDMIDRKIEKEKYSRDIVVPVEYTKVTGKRVSFKCRSFVNRFENYYFGSNARYIDNAEDLSIYRGTYRNLDSLDGVSYSSLLEGNNSVISKFDKTNVKLKSIGASYDIFSSQAEGNRGYSMVSVEGDLDIYDENKTAMKSKKQSKSIFGRIRRRAWPEICKEESDDNPCENLNDFAKRRWGGASSINLNNDSISQGRYELSGYTATDSWRSIFGMGGFQSLLPGSDEGFYGKGWVSGTGTGPQRAATSYKSYMKYSSPTEREGWRKFSWMVFGKGYEVYENHTPDVHMSFNDMDYRRLRSNIMNSRSFSKESSKIFNVSYTASKRMLKCGGSEKYSYKVINSVVKHDSTTQDEINGIDKDRYGENGTLGIYYRDIKAAYEDLSGDLSDILDSFPELMSFINSGNEYIENKINELSGAGNQLSQIKTEIARLNSEIFALNSELNNLRLELASLEDETQIENIRNQIIIIEGRISLKSQDLDTANNNRANVESSITNVLRDVRKFLFDDTGECEKDKLIDVYQLIGGLYVENIISIMEYIIYLEGADPEWYYSESPDGDLVKIGFLPEWISDIKNIENSIKVRSRNIAPYYSQAYSGILAQQSLWRVLASKLIEISDDNIDEINSITEDFDAIFTLQDTGDADIDLEPSLIILTGGTASGEMINFNLDLSRVSSLFGKLVEVDRTGPAIVAAAKTDNDFLKRLSKHSIIPSSNEEWINQYAKWAKGAGYDSEGAKKNHDLLLGASEHIPGMNILTPDRPIDSPRYVSMQSIAGNEIKLIYPDLFKVEVFALTGKNKSGYDIHELLTGGQIRGKIVEYLKGKVKEYNQILALEYSSAGSDSDVYSSRLKSLGFNLATSDKNKSVRPYSYFTYEDFEKALGGSGMITALSEMLYYQNLTNKKKLSAGLVSEDIDMIKKSFSLNDKREQVLKDYLVQGNEKKRNLLFDIPMYEPLGYEVAFVNSDGRDYIIPTSSDDAKEMPNEVNTQKSVKLNRQDSEQEKDLNNECNIPMNGKLPLFKLDGTSVSSPWLIGFKCWWKKTLEEPFKLKLTFDRSIGEILSSSGFDGFVNSLFSETTDSLNAWGDSLSKYADEWDTLVNHSTGFDADKAITQLQIEAEKHNNESLRNLRNLKISNSNELLSDNNPASLFKIESVSDIGLVNVTFTSTGDGCLSINDKSLCGDNSVKEVFNPKTNPFSGLITSADHAAGKVGLDVKISLNDSYIEKIIKYTVSPSEVTKFVIKVDDEKTFAGLVSPVEVIGYDKYGNRVSWGLEKYDFTVTKGRFLKDGAYQDGFSTNDFRNLRFYYQAPLDAVDGDKSFIQVSKKTSSGSVEYLTTYPQTLAYVSPVVKINGNTILQGNNLVGNDSYRLKSSEDIYNDGKLDVSKLQRIDVEMRDKNGNLVDLDSQILVTSQNGLVIIGQIQKQENGNFEFRETSKTYISGGKVSLYYYPTTVAGEDKLNIDIPGLDLRVINLSILPGPAARIQTVLEKDVLYLGDTMDFELFVSDRWGNSVDGFIGPIGIDYDPDMVEFVTPLDSDKDGVAYVGTNDGYGGKFTIKGIGAGLTSFLVGGVFGGDVYFYVDKHIFPNSGLNVMYLNYFGDDWGNQWGYFSDNNKYVEKLMSKSKKVITTTTQLVSEDKIKKMVWKISPGFSVWNPDGLDTILTIEAGKSNISIGGISSMKSSLPSFKWVTGSGDASDLVKGLKNYIYFVPSDPKYSIDKNGILLDSGSSILNLAAGEASFQLSKKSLDDGSNIWTLLDRGVNYGDIIIHFTDFKPSMNDFVSPGERYLVSSTFTNGSTYSLSSVGIFDLLSDFELETNYKSIQNSDEVDERIGFLGDFKNITLFAEGEIVGEATRKFGSEFVINLGDPVLSRTTSNENIYGTEYDGGVGQEIFTDSENDIFGTYQINFNNDDYDDLLVVYLDGTIKLAKSYGGVPDLRNLQELMRIAVPIEEVFVGDVNGDKYDDIFIRTDNNQLRAYLNDKGKFDVNGRVACLNQNVFEGEISSSPSSLDGIFQLFVEDMDDDGSMDVVTYDNKGYIKVFYGGSTAGGPNYLSNNAYACDSGWYEREVKNMKIVTALGVQVSNLEVYDNSMLRWVGIKKPEIKITEEELSEYGIHFDPDTLSSLVKERKRNEDGSIDELVHEIMGDGGSDSSRYNFDISEASQKFVDESAKFVDVTLYENTLVGGGSGKNYIFAPISYLDGVRKNYSLKSGSKILQDGDIVTVRVTIKASDNFVGSFGDVIQGPRNLHYDKDGIMKGIRFITNQGAAVVKKKDGNFSYIVDNIRLSPGETMVFEYDLEFKSIPLRKISLTYDTYYSDDLFPDIKLQSVDGCSKDFDVYINGGHSRSFSITSVPLQKMIDETYNNEDENTEDYTQDVLDAGSDVNQLPGIVGDTLRRISLLKSSSLSISDDEEGREELKDILLERIGKGGLESLNIDLNINLSIFEEQSEYIEKVIDDITKGMCNGFSFGGSSNCKGLPVPFNQAFLAPGKYHIFGCRDLPLGRLEKGLPVFFFPGTLPTPLGPIPIPWGQTGPGDGFLWVGGGSWPSLIRIYAAPTLTAQLGIAVCVGPYAAGAALKSPFSDIGGNCVVFAIKPQCKNSNPDENLDNPDQSYVEFVEDVRDSGVCLQSQKGPQVTINRHRSSPFNSYSYTSDYHLDLDGGSHNEVEFHTRFLGVIELETSAYIAADDDTVGKNSIMIGDVDILGGDFSVNKIKGGIQQGVRKILIDNWLDPQIRYIINQLTKMHVNVKLPDFANLIDNEVSVMQNVSENIGDVLGDEKEAIKPDFVSSFSNITNDNLKAYSESISNPFETLANLMNESNIVNISTETLTVKIPLITSDDINSYEFYLNLWIERNSEIVKEWKDLLNKAKLSCNNKSSIEEKRACLEEAEKNLSSFVEFEGGDWKKMLDQVYANLAVLQQYRNFPFEIYEWIHVIDRYMTEIASLINNTIGYLSYWTVTNSERFVGYVDAIVLVLNIIKTYQLIIDFSVDWSKNCGNCAKDTYDQYSCKLSLLCNSIKLPIIQIPNFKLPNITIDLSNMNLGLDIILPEFNFQPIRVNLPDLPNLPEPPAVGLNIRLFDLPNIPLLPQPPTLPELPSFIPEVELELPILPPAPELPKLPNKIEGIIKVANLIGKIYCIVKGQFGLVGESSVKAKIEQLTQRTYEVSWIDNIMNFTNRSVAPVKNYGVDYEIGSYVDLQFDFSAFYDYLDILTKGINNLSTTVEKGLNDQIDSAFDINPLRNIRNSIDNANIELNVDLTKSDSSSLNIDFNGYTSDEIEYVDYSSAKNRLQEVLSFFKGELNKTTLADSIGGSITKIENQINRPSKVVANEDGLQSLRNQVVDYINAKQNSYDDIANLINENYDDFIAMVGSSNSINSTGDGKVLTFNTQLFNLDSSTRETISSISNANPYQSIIDNKKEIIDGYWNAINSNTSSDLGLTDSQYLVLRDGISSLKNQVSMLYSMSKPISTTNLVKDGVVSEKSLVAGNRIGSNMKVAKVIDPSLFSNGIYEKITQDGPDKGKLTKVVNSDEFVEKIGGQYYDTDHTDKHDIILWDEDSVYLKCHGQVCSNGGVPDPKYYSAVIKEVPYEETWISFGSSTKLKIADFNQEVKNWKVIGQSYDTLSFSWSLDADADAYLIKLVERIDHSYEKAEYSSNGKAIESSYRYVLAIPEGTDIDNSLKLELLKKKVKSIVGLRELIQIVYYNDHKDIANIVISNIDDIWYYARICTLNLNGNTYDITSPWSNQVVAGKQVVGDDQPPVTEQSLKRLSIPEVINGDDLDGFVGTNYELEVKWKDNVALSYISISKNGRILAEKYTSSAEDNLNINVGMHFKAEKEFYDLLGIDQFGNKIEKTISVSYYVPDISITDVSKNADGESVTIFAELSKDIDQGNVSFQRRRGNAWKTMNRKLSDSSDLQLAPGINNIVGSGYSAGNDIAMYDKNNEVIALMDPNTAEIKIQSGYEDLYGVSVSVANSAVLNIYDKISKENKFSISLPTKKCVSLEAESFDIVGLPENGRMGMFNGGSAIYKDGDIVLLASPTCHLYSEIGLQGTYSFDRERNAVLLVLYLPWDSFKDFPIKVWLETSTFLAR